MFVIDQNKSSRPDGFGSDFFKNAWHIVRNDIIEEILQFFHNGMLLKQVNAMVISLIPKIAYPMTTTDNRPIACCNIIFKCISKMLCDRLAKVLSCLVKDNQSTFIKGRNIVENVLIN